MKKFGEFMLQDKRLIVAGGTGSLGKVLVRRLLTGEMGLPLRVQSWRLSHCRAHGRRQFVLSLYPNMPLEHIDLVVEQLRERLSRSG
jgi:hypothetical protein